MGADPRSILVGDFNGDGRLDLTAAQEARALVDAGLEALPLVPPWVGSTSPFPILPGRASRARS